MYVDRVRVRRSVLQQARARALASARSRSRVCVKGECARVIVCAFRCAGREGEGRRGERRELREGPIDGPRERRTTSVGSLRHQNGRKDFACSIFSCSRERCECIEASADDDRHRRRQMGGRIHRYRRRNCCETSPSSFLLSLFCLRYVHLSTASFSVSLCLSSSLSLAAN